MSKDNVRMEIKKSIKVDGLIAKVIKFLNEKGYATKFCCRVHPENLEKLGENRHSMGKIYMFPLNKFLLIMCNIPEKWSQQDSTIYIDIIRKMKK